MTTSNIQITPSSKPSMDALGSCIIHLVCVQGRLLATVGSRVIIYRWAQQDDGSHELEEHCACHAGNVYALYCVTRGDFILVGESGLDFWAYRSCS